MRIKPIRVKDSVTIIYDEEHWRLFSSLREKAVNILKALKSSNIEGYIIGSLARGDIHNGSDIDIIVKDYVPTFFIENILLDNGFNIFQKIVTQATPNSLIKASIFIDDTTSVSIPLSKMSKVEEEFFEFAGIISYNEVINNIRVPGVNKRLLLIVPNREGHIEYSIIGREYHAAMVLNVSPRIVFEREKILLRRDEIGRTGVYLKIIVPPEANIEKYVRDVVKQNPLLRKKLSSIF